MSHFHFKHFSIQQANSALKVGTDAMVLGTLINCEGKKHGLDIGSGTGVLSLMIAQKNDSIELTAVEIDSDTALDCLGNFQDSIWSDRLTLIEGDFLEFNPESKFDLVFSNPPFFENSSENPKQNKAVARHTKSLPLDGLFEKVSNLLGSNGSFWIILPYQSEGRAKELASKAELSLLETWIIEGKPGNPVRNVFHFIKNGEFTKHQSSVFVVRDMEGKYTEQYIKATIEFHGKSL